MKAFARALLPILLLASAPAWGQGIITIGALPSASTPLAGSEVVPIMQGGITRKVTVANILPNSGVSAGVYGDGTHCITGLTVGANGVITAVTQTIAASCPGGAGGGLVTSVFGRAGVVVANTGDYTFAQITGTPTTLLGYGITDAVDQTSPQTLTNKSFDFSLNTATNIPYAALQFDPSNATNLTSGTVASARLPIATTAVFGAMKPDGTTIVCVGGVCSATTGGSGSVSTTGTPASGNLTKFTGLTTISNGDLSGDCATSGTLAVLCTKTGGVVFAASATTNALNATNINAGTLTAARLPLGKSVVDAGAGLLEATLPIQTNKANGSSCTTSCVYAAADLQFETRRSNSGTAMTDTLPPSSTVGLANGARQTITNVDATASDTLSAGAGTTIGGSGMVEAGTSITYAYDLPNTIWRPTFNTGTAGVFSTPTGNVVGDVVVMRTTGRGVQDSGISLSNLAGIGTGGIYTSNPSLVASDFNVHCRILTIDAGSLNITLPQANTLAANGGCFVITTPTAHSVTVTPNGADSINHGLTGAAVTLSAGITTYVTSDGINSDFVPTGAAGSSGFPFTLGSTSIAASSTVTTLAGLTLTNPTVNAAALSGTITGTPTFSGNLTFSGANAYGTPASLTATNVTGLPLSGLTGLGTGVQTLLGGTPSGTSGLAGTASPTFTGTLTAAALTASGTVTLSGITGSTQCLQVNSSGVIAGSGAGCGGGGGAVSSVSNSDSTLTVSPTTGAVVASLNLGHTNTWTVQQVISAAGAASTPAFLMTGQPFAGTATTSQPLFALNDASATAETDYGTNGTFIGVNARSGFNTSSSYFINLAVNGARVIGLRANGEMDLVNIVATGELKGNPLSIASNISFGSPSTGIVRINADSATPGAVQIRPQNGLGTNINAGSFTIQGGQSTGTGTSGDLIFNTGIKNGGSNSTLGTATLAMTIKGETQEVQFAALAKLKSYIVTGLPTGAAGDLAIVTDANAACTFGSTPAGSGSTVCKVWYNGTGWVEGSLFFVIPAPFGRRRRKKIANDNHQSQVA